MTVVVQGSHQDRRYKTFSPNVVRALSEVNSVGLWNIFSSTAHWQLQGNCKCVYHEHHVHAELHFSVIVVEI